MDRKGQLIVFEGIDGSGKSTQVKMLSEYLTSKGIPNITSAEPTHGEWGEHIRNLAAKGVRMPFVQEVTFLLNDRAEHVQNVILPALNEGKWVILDRYYLSMMAYQGRRTVTMRDYGELYGGNSELFRVGPLARAQIDQPMVQDFIYRLNGMFAPVYDACMYIDVPVETAMERIAARGAADAFERKEDLESFKAEFDRLNMLAMCDRIDGAGTAQEVHERVVQHLKEQITEFPKD